MRGKLLSKGCLALPNLRSDFVQQHCGAHGGDVDVGVGIDGGQELLQ